MKSSAQLGASKRIASVFLFALLMVTSLAAPSSAAETSKMPRNVFISGVTGTGMTVVWDEPIDGTPMGYSLEHRCGSEGFRTTLTPPGVREVTVGCKGEIYEVGVSAEYFGVSSDSAYALNAAIAVHGLQRAGETLSIEFIGWSWRNSKVEEIRWLVDGELADTASTFVVSNEILASTIALEVTATFSAPAAVRTFRAESNRPIIEYDSCMIDGCPAPPRFFRVKGNISSPTDSQWNFDLQVDGKSLPLFCCQIGPDFQWLQKAEDGTDVTSRITNARHGWSFDSEVEGVGDSEFDIYLDRNRLEHRAGVRGHNFELIVQRASVDPRHQIVEEKYSFNVDSVTPYFTSGLEISQFKTSAQASVDVHWPSGVKSGQYVVNWYVDDQLYTSSYLDSANPVSKLQLSLTTLPSNYFYLAAIPQWQNYVGEGSYFRYDPTRLNTNLQSIEISQVGKMVKAKVTGIFSSWTDRKVLALDWVVDDVQIATSNIAVGQGEFVVLANLGNIPTGSKYIQVQVAGEPISLSTTFEVQPTEGPAYLEWTNGFSEAAEPNSKVKVSGRVYSNYPIRVTTVRYRSKPKNGVWSKYSTVKLTASKSFAVKQKVTNPTLVEVSFLDPFTKRTIVERQTIEVAAKFKIKATYKSNKVGNVELGGTWTFNVSGQGGYAECGAILRAGSATSPYLPFYFADNSMGVGSGSSKNWKFTAKQRFNGHYSISVMCLYRGYAAKTIKVQ